MSKRVALYFTGHKRPVLLSLNDSQEAFEAKCDEAARRLFGDDAFCELLEMEPFGELIPESYDAIRDGDKITATIGRREAKQEVEKDVTLLDKEDWKAMRESKINPGLEWQKFVEENAGTVVVSPALQRRNDNKKDDEDKKKEEEITAAYARNKPPVMPPPKKKMEHLASPRKSNSFSERDSDEKTKMLKEMMEGKPSRGIRRSRSVGSGIDKLQALFEGKATNDAKPVAPRRPLPGKAFPNKPNRSVGGGAVPKPKPTANALADWELSLAPKEDPFSSAVASTADDPMKGNVTMELEDIDAQLRMLDEQIAADNADQEDDFTYDFATVRDKQKSDREQYQPLARVQANASLKYKKPSRPLPQGAPPPHQQQQPTETDRAGGARSEMFPSVPCEMPPAASSPPAQRPPNIPNSPPPAARPLSPQLRAPLSPQLSRPQPINRPNNANNNNNNNSGTRFSPPVLNNSSGHAFTPGSPVLHKPPSPRENPQAEFQSHLAGGSIGGGGSRRRGGPPPKPTVKNDSTMRRAELMRKNASGADFSHMPPPSNKPMNTAELVRSKSLQNTSAGGIQMPARAYGGGAVPKFDLAHKPPPNSLVFDGRPAPLLVPALARAVTKTSGPFSCPVCFNSYPIAADVFHHCKKRHRVEITDGPAVADANLRQHAIKRTANSGGFFTAAHAHSPTVNRKVPQSAHTIGARPGRRGTADLPPGWVKVWSRSKQKHYYYNERTGKSIWTLAAVFQRPDG